MTTSVTVSANHAPNIEVVVEVREKYYDSDTATFITVEQGIPDTHYVYGERSITIREIVKE